MALWQKLFKHRGSNSKKSSIQEGRNGISETRKSRGKSPKSMIEPEVSSSTSTLTANEDFLEDDSYYSSDDKYCCFSPPFCKENFRLVIFRESDRGRRLVFDSKSVRPRRSSEVSFSPSEELHTGYRSTNGDSNGRYSRSPGQNVPFSSDQMFEFSKHQTDTKLLGEMIYGAMAMAYKGESMKLHQFKRPNQIMLTKVFPGPKTCLSRRTPRQAVISENGTFDCQTSSDSDRGSDSQYSTITSVDGLGDKAQASGGSLPMAVPDTVYKTPVGSLRTSDSHESLRPFQGSNGTLETNRERSTNSGSTNSSGSLVPPPGMSRSQSEVGSAVSGLTQGRMPSPRSVDSCLGSPLSRHARIRLSQMNSLSNGVDAVLNRRRSSGSLGDDSLLSRRRDQFGLAVLFNFDESGAGGEGRNGVTDSDNDKAKECFRRFLLTHMHLVETEMRKLQTSIARASLCKSSFLELVFKSWSEFCSAILVLYNAPRLCEPVWLSLMGCCQPGGTPQGAGPTSKEALEHKEDRLMKNFVDVFCRLVDELDVKKTHFFLSRVLTAVLKSHLSWVGSVAPSNKPSASMMRYQRRTKNRRRSGLDKIGEEENRVPDLHQMRMEENCADSASNPYNPFWAQYLDVMGAVGYPVKSARTLVLGREKSLVTELLYLLSYFIRCSEIQETKVSEKLEENHFKEAPLPVFSEFPQKNGLPIPNKQENRVESPPRFTIITAPDKSDSITIGFKNAGDTETHGTTISEEQPKESPLELGSDLPDCSRVAESVPESPELPEAPGLAGTSRAAERVPEVRISGFQVRSVTETALLVGQGEAGGKEEGPKAASKPSVPASLVQLFEPIELNPVMQAMVQTVMTNGADEADLTVSRQGSSQSQTGKKISVDSGYVSGTGGRKISVDETALNRGCRKKSEVSKVPFMEKIEDGRSSGEEKEETASRPSIDSGIDAMEAMKLLEDSRNFDSNGAQAKAQGENRERTKRKTTPNSKEMYQRVFKDSKVENLDRHKSLVPGLLTEPFPSPSMDCALSSETNSATEDRWPTDDLGRSMLTGFLPIFGSHFALSGAPVTQDIYSVIWDELHSGLDGNVELAGTRVGVDGKEPPSVCVVADTTDWSVKVVSSDLTGYNLNDTEVACPAQSVASMVENTKLLREMESAPDFCLMHIEDSLGDLYTKSVCLAETLEDMDSDMDMGRLCRLVGCDWSDWPLLKSVASVHSPEVMCSLLA